MDGFAARLVRWQARHGRHGLPWQHTRDPYRVWLAEIMLQQTRVETVIPYYQRFLERFPDLDALAAGPIDEVLGLWSGLGYYARARNLHAAARRIVAEHGGAFPRHADGIAALPGVGRSSAAAIAAFAFGRRGAILDGNVRRVLCRAFGIDGCPAEREVERRLWALAERLVPARGVARYTQALMDLGATVCTRVRPACDRCPVRSECVARRQARTAELPSPRPARRLPERRVTALVVFARGQVLLDKRPYAGLWGGLMSLPELPEGAEPAAFCAAHLACELASVDKLDDLRIGFTHFRMVLEPLLCLAAARQPHCAQDRYRWVARSRLGREPVPAPILRLLDHLPVTDDRH